MRLVIATVLLAACGNGSGGHCTTTADCMSGLVCASASEGRRLCMHPCDYDAGELDGGGHADQHLCADGATCLVIESMRLCYVGGGHPIGSTCTDDLECESGTVCTSDTHVCAQACTVGVDIPCAANETCMPVSNGICRAPVLVLDGGT